MQYSSDLEKLLSAALASELLIQICQRLLDQPCSLPLSREIYLTASNRDRAEGFYSTSLRPPANIWDLENGKRKMEFSIAQAQDGAAAAYGCGATEAVPAGGLAQSCL